MDRIPQTFSILAKPSSSNIIKTLQFSIIILSLLGSPIIYSQELSKKIVCTWDPVGTNGPVVSFFSDLIPIAISWGLNLSFVPYEEETRAIEDLTNGKCDIAIVTAILSRDLVPFAGTLDAIGGITSNTKLKEAIAALSSPKAKPLMSHGDYEVVASLPVGSMFAFVNDRKIRGIEGFKGKKMAILNHDIQTKTFAELAGAYPIQTSLTKFSHLFNEGSVDIVLMPALAYNTFELYRGLGNTGGILDIRLFYGMLQAISRKSAFPENFGTNMRQYMVGRLDNIITLIDKAEEAIPNEYWIKTSQKTKDELESFYKDIRLKLKVENKFSPKALSLLWKIRCLSSPQREECVMP